MCTLPAVLLLAASPAALAGTVEVPGDHATITEAIAAAAPGDVVEVGPGVWGETVLIDKDLSLIGVNGSSATALVDGTDASAVLAIEDAVVYVAGFTIDNLDANGRAIVVETAAVDFVDLTISNQSTNGRGAAMRISMGSTVAVDGSTFADNSSGSHGGHIGVTDSSLTVTGSTFSGGIADDGGAIWVEDGWLDVSSTTFSGNSAPNGQHRGGAIWGDTSDVTLVDVAFADNTSDAEGGHVHVSAGASLVATDCTFTGGQAASLGGAIYADASSGWIADSTFTGNLASEGGAVAADGWAPWAVLRSAFDTNTAAVGGALWIDGSWALSLRDNTFTGNQAGSGGALYAADIDDIAVVRNLWCGNAATVDHGGAVWAETTGEGSVRTWTNNVVVENTAAADGGGLYLWGGAADIHNNHLVGNAAAGQGGGVEASGLSSGSTFRNNLVAWTVSGNGLHGSGVAVTYAYNDFYANATSHVSGLLLAGSGNRYQDPVLTGYSLDGDCGNDAWWPAPGSPLVDAGDPAISDPDGGPSDIGAYGGPAAPGDADSDGVPAGPDCDDDDPDVHPGATEVCDALDVDEDCDGYADDADPQGASGGSVWHADLDGDGFGDQDDPGTLACDAPADQVADATDCDDGVFAVNPDAVEVCDPLDVDEDCDGYADGADPEGASGAASWYPDGDGDGFGDQDDPGTVACDPPADHVADATDCDDGAFAVNPAASEVCDALDVDEDCDGQADDADAQGAAGATAWYPDTDGDGYGDAGAAPVMACDAPADHVADATDCDDGSGAVSPAASEVCDALDVDEDCDGLADDADPEGASEGTTWYPDADDDGFGDAQDPGTVACDPPQGHVADNADCDDGAAAVNPDAQEVCDPDDVDEDCDGLADDADDSAIGQTDWYGDSDGDGHGDAGAPVAACDPGPGRAPSPDDCNDGDATVHPGAQEVCDPDDVDEDCDGLADDDDGSVTGTQGWCPDADGDGFGDATAAIVTGCDAEGLVADCSDCDDGAYGVHPGMEDIPGDRMDQDCDGVDAGRTLRNGAAACGCATGGSPAWWFAFLVSLAVRRRR